MNRQENNKIIAEFMGLKYYEPFFEVTEESQMERIEVREGKAISFGYMFEPHELKYHESWDWLMSVVKKCFQTGDDTYEWDNIMDTLFTCDIDIVYAQVVEFINQYNESTN